MANEEHVKLLKHGVENWNKWREENPDIQPDLSEISLSNLDLCKINFSHTNLTMTNCSQTKLCNANFTNAILTKTLFAEAYLISADFRAAKISDTLFEASILVNSNFNNPDKRGWFGNVRFLSADLSGANLYGNTFRYSDFSRAKLCGANLAGTDFVECIFGSADLSEAVLTDASFYSVELCDAKLEGAVLNRAKCIKTDFRWANLTGADLADADLTSSTFVHTKLNGANIKGCKVFGISAWGIETDESTIQTDLLINDSAPEVFVDNIEIAQFIYLLLNNNKIRDVINTVSSKAVLILGRFGERKANLDLIREKLRDLGYLPIMFDFEKPTNKDTVETVLTLAGLSKFVIADLTQPRSIPIELNTIVSNMPTLPVHLLLQKGEDTFGMVDHILTVNTISGITRYSTINELLDNFYDEVIHPVNEWKNKNKEIIESKLKELL